jgi:hypothetical protein
MTVHNLFAMASQPTSRSPSVLAIPVSRRSASAVVGYAVSAIRYIDGGFFSAEALRECNG